jgi:hypothetical protein
MSSQASRILAHSAITLKVFSSIRRMGFGRGDDRSWSAVLLIPDRSAIDVPEGRMTVFPYRVVAGLMALPLKIKF